MQSPRPDAFGELLRHYRRAAELSTRGVSDLERGVNRTPQPGTLRLLAEVAEPLGDPTAITATVRAHGYLAYCRGEWERARVDYERAASISQGKSSRFATHPPLLLAELCMARGERDAAIGHLQAILARDDCVADPYPPRAAYGLLAELELLAGRPELAARRLQTLPDLPQSTAKARQRPIAAGLGGHRAWQRDES